MTAQQLFLTDQFRSALNFAYQLHKNQFRKGSGVPYLSHLLGVAGLVMEDGGTETEVIAALLHDAVEDQGGALTLKRIKIKFGTQVAAIVDFCTDSLEIPQPPWRERKLAIIRKVALASESEYRILLADKLHNLWTIRNALWKHGDAVWERFKGGKEGSLWYYRELLSNFQERGDHPFLEDMEAILKALQDPAD